MLSKDTFYTLAVDCVLLGNHKIAKDPLIAAGAPDSALSGVI
jgi:hypothetical protein